jgi:hypothetical protein
LLQTAWNKNRNQDQKTMKTHLLAQFCLSAFTLTSAFSAGIMDWDASNYSGTFGDGWTDSIANVTAASGGGGAPNPVKNTGSINGFSVDYLTFTADSFDVNPTTTPITGLAEFSISMVFRLPTSYTAPNVPENNFYQHNGVAGKERSGAGTGDWNVGFVDVAGDGTVQLVGGSGLGSGDVGTAGSITVADNAWHTSSFVVEDLGDGSFNQLLYLDGVLIASDLAISYGGSDSSIAADNWAIGARRDGDNGYLQEGDIARLQFDDTALTLSEVEASHATFLGEAVPEPSSTMLLVLGCFALGRRSRR